jgi:DNA-binding NarL/FixJ family response regulator
VHLQISDRLVAIPTTRGGLGRRERNPRRKIPSGCSLINADYAAGRLTPRQADVAGLLVQGLRNREIARKLNMRERTVKGHMSRLFVHFGLGGSMKRVKLAMLLASSR